MTDRPLCPVCGCTIVRPIVHKTLPPQESGETEVIAYRCGNGHVFLPGKEVKTVAAGRAM